jgi:hypothetical protein
MIHWNSVLYKEENSGLSYFCADFLWIGLYRSEKYFRKNQGGENKGGDV